MGNVPLTEFYCTFIRMNVYWGRENGDMPRYKLTLSVERDLVDRMKMQAVREHRDLSDITEQLYQQYLEAAEESTETTKSSKKRGK